MARIIGLTNQKGGTGKTTTAINLAAYLAAKGKFVLLVDLDPQANATSGLGINPRDLRVSLYHTLIGQAFPQEIIKKTRIFAYDLLPASSDMAGAVIELVNMENRELKLYEVLKKVRTDYDYIIIDCPPSLGLLTINGLVATEEVIIPVQCEYYALEGLGQLLGTIDLVKTNLEREIEIAGALLTMFDRRNRLSHEVVKEVRRNFPGNVFDTIIPRNIQLAEAPSFGQTILQFAPYSKGARAYQQLAEEIISLEQTSS